MIRSAALSAWSIPRAARSWPVTLTPTLRRSQGQASVYVAPKRLSSIDPAAPLLPPDDPNQIALASLDQAPSASDLIASVESVDGTASYSYDAAGQLTGAHISPISNPSLIPPPILFLRLQRQPHQPRLRHRPGQRTALRWHVQLPVRCRRQPDRAHGHRHRRDNPLHLGQPQPPGERDRRDSQGQITQTVTYQYDASNRWIGETVTTYASGSPSSVHTTDFAYDGNQIVLQFDATSSPLPPGSRARECG